MDDEISDINCFEKRIQELNSVIKTLQDTNKLYLEIFDKLPLGLRVYDSANNIVLSNQNFKSILENYDTQNLNPKGILNGEDEQNLIDNWHQLFELNKQFEREFEILPKPFNENFNSIIIEPRILNEIVSKLGNSETDVNYFLSSLFDITEIREKNNLINAQLKDYQEINHKLEKAFDKVKQSEAQFRMLIDNAPGPIIILIDLKFEYVNKAALKLYGAELATHLTGRNFSELIHPDFRNLVSNKLKNIESNNSHSSFYESKHLKIDQTPIDVEVSAVPVKYNNKSAILVFLNDITERIQFQKKLIEKNKALESSEEAFRVANEKMITITNELIFTNQQLTEAKLKAEESDRLKTAFLQNISHEIRTPLNAIIGFSELMNNQSLTIEKRRYFTEMMNQGSNQLLSIINDIIAIATIEAGQEKANESKVNINALLKSVHAQFSIKVGKQGINFNYNSPFNEKNQLILTDKTKLETIFNCLISNAIKFTTQGTIEFGCKLKGNSLLCFVKDSGIGIEEKYHNVIFEPFRQVEITPTRTYSGSGLGLSISKAYVGLLGGQIWVESEPKKGSCFYFTIPYKKALPEVENKQIPMWEYPLQNSVKVLIAEDEDSNYLVLEEWLSEISIKTTRAFNGLEAINFCQNDQDIKIILMDIKMPVMDGLEATKKIKQFDQSITIIAQTAYSFTEERKLALNAGCDYFITKPINKSELFRIINQVLDELPQKQ